MNRRVFVHSSEVHHQGEHRLSTLEDRAWLLNRSLKPFLQQDLRVDIGSNAPKADAPALHYAVIRVRDTDGKIHKITLNQKARKKRLLPWNQTLIGFLFNVRQTVLASIKQHTQQT